MDDGSWLRRCGTRAQAHRAGLAGLVDLTRAIGLARWSLTAGWLVAAEGPAVWLLICLSLWLADFSKGRVAGRRDEGRGGPVRADGEGGRAARGREGQARELRVVSRG